MTDSTHIQTPSDNDTSVEALKRICRDFRDARDWKRFHNPKDLSLALSCEAAELLELFRFKDTDDMARDMAVPAHRDAVSEEMADILYWLLMLSDHSGIDLSRALVRKMAINEQRYPAAQAHGRNVKYTVLQEERGQL